MADVYLSLGSNIGNKAQYLKNALSELKKLGEIVIVSNIYETPPWGKLDQNYFYNICVHIKTGLEPQEFLYQIKQIEENLGRKKRDKWAEREIDIDILFYDSLVINEQSLTIPHEHVDQRAFVLIPLDEIAPDFIHPKLNLSIKDLKEKNDSTGIKKRGKL